MLVLCSSRQKQPPRVDIYSPACGQQLCHLAHAAQERSVKTSAVRCLTQCITTYLRRFAPSTASTDLLKWLKRAMSGIIGQLKKASFPSAEQQACLPTACAGSHAIKLPGTMCWRSLSMCAVRLHVRHSPDSVASCTAGAHPAAAVGCQSARARLCAGAAGGAGPERAHQPGDEHDWAALAACRSAQPTDVQL